MTRLISKLTKHKTIHVAENKVTHIVQVEKPRNINRKKVTSPLKELHIYLHQILEFFIKCLNQLSCAKEREKLCDCTYLVITQIQSSLICVGFILY